MGEASVLTFNVVAAEEGERLDAVLAERSELSRSRIQRMVEGGRVQVDGRVTLRKSERVFAGQVLRLEVPPPRRVELVAQDLPLEVVYEDEVLLVVNKQAGMVVHPAPGHPAGTLVNALLHHVGELAAVGDRLRPGLVHRLDKDTSGLLLVAKNDAAHQGLSEALKRRRVRRRYLAATWGHLTESPVTVDAPIGRDPRDRKRMAVHVAGRRAVTRARVRERWVAGEMLDVALQTGRTHQIRVHMAHLGHPVVGDELYGGGKPRGGVGPVRTWSAELARRTPRQFLHAAELGFEHPVTGEKMRLRAALPADLADVVAWAASGEREREPPRSAGRGGPSP